jgi:LCP family protein required for cell wall assembly
MGRHAPGAGRPYARPRRRWRWIGLGLLAALILGAGLFYWQIVRLSAAITVTDVRGGTPLASPLAGANVLLVGVDERPDHPDEGVRSDTLILVRVDAIGRWVTLLSIPRDTQVDIPGVGVSKINVAYGQGYARASELYGPEATPRQAGMAFSAETVETFLQLRERGVGVDYIAQVNFAGFAGVIDALGGVWIDVPRPIVDEAYPTEDFGTVRVEFAAGRQLMDGERALIYARTRHADSDFGRAERQQQVLRAMLQAFQERGLPGQVLALPGLLESVAGDTENPPPLLTTMPIDRPDVLLGLLGLAGGVSPDEIGTLSLNPETVGVSEVGSNLIWDPNGVQALIDRFFTPPSEASEAARVQVFNGTDVSGLANAISLELAEADFTLLPAANAPPGDYPRTIVYDLGHAPRTSARVARTLGAERVQADPPAGLVSEAEVVVVLGNDRATAP